MSTSKPKPETIQARQAKYQKEKDNPKRCYKCGVTKPCSDFSFDSTRSNGISSKCKKCSASHLDTLFPGPERNKRKRLKRRERGQILKKILAKDGCAVCQESELCCLHFHHVDPTHKEAEFARLFERGKLEQVLEEISKGVVILCANCHAKAHNGIIEITNDLALSPTLDLDLLL